MFYVKNQILIDILVNIHVKAVTYVYWGTFLYKQFILHSYVLIINYHVYIICLSIDMDPLPTQYLDYDNCRNLGMSIEG